MNPNLLCHSGCTYTHCISYTLWYPNMAIELPIYIWLFLFHSVGTSVWWHRRVLYMFWVIQVYHCCCYTYFTHNVHHTHIIHTCILYLHIFTYIWVFDGVNVGKYSINVPHHFAVVPRPWQCFLHADARWQRLGQMVNLVSHPMKSIRIRIPGFSHQNSWDLWMFIPPNSVMIGFDPRIFVFFQVIKKYLVDVRLNPAKHNLEGSQQVITWMQL